RPGLLAAGGCRREGRGRPGCHADYTRNPPGGRRGTRSGADRNAGRSIAGRRRPAGDWAAYYERAGSWSGRRGDPGALAPISARPELSSSPALAPLTGTPTPAEGCGTVYDRWKAGRQQARPVSPASGSGVSAGPGAALGDRATTPVSYPEQPAGFVE